MRPPRIALLVSLLASLPAGLLLPLSITSDSTYAAQAQTPESRNVEAGRLLQQGEQQFQKSQYHEAIQFWQQALAIYQAASNRNGEASTLANLGNAYNSISRPTEAIKYHQQALVIFQEIGNRNGEANVLVNFGNAYSALSEYQEAMEYYQQALPIFQQVGDRNGEANTLANLGAAYNFLSQYQEAMEYYQQALPIFQQVSDRNGEANTLANLGNAYNSISRPTEAIKYHQQALVIFQEIGNRNGEAKTLANLGVAYFSLSEYTRAIEHYQQALPIFQQVGDRYGGASALMNLGAIYGALSQYQREIEYYQKVLPIFQEIGDRNGEARTLNNLGAAYVSLSRYPKALEHFQQALSLYQQVGDRNGEAKVLTNLGRTYNSLSQYQKEIEYHQRALSIFQETGNSNGGARALNNLGLAYFSLDQYSQAIEYYQQALPIYQQVGDRNGEADTLANLGAAYNFLSQYQEAMEYYQQALPIFQQVGDRNGEAKTLSNFGLIYHALSQYPKAIEYYQQALDLLHQVGDRNGEGITLNNLGLVFFKLGDVATAEKTLATAIKIWESLRAGLTDKNKVSIFEAQARTYRTLQQVLIAQNKPEAALEIAERGRARAFVELLAQKFSDETKIQNQATIQAPDIQQIKQIAKAQNAALVQYSIIYDNFSIQGKQTFQESALYIWVIQPNGKISFREVDLKPLSQRHDSSVSSLIVEQQEFLEVRNRQGLTFNPPPLTSPPQPDLPTLYQLLIEPIADLLPQDPNAHVIFIPQGPLFQVPFPALQDAKGDYLIQKHTILTAPSIQVLALTRQQRERLASQQKSNSSEALVLGNPTMPSISLSPGEPKQPLSPLPGAATEAKAIATLLNTKAITGAQGTETAIAQKMPQARLIHLATHGLLDDIQGLGSAIALTPSRTDDGLLTAAEILDMQLQAELVVLSACNTARGRVTGDGVIGLSRSLIAAGVPSVLVSLWAVPDAPTAELMTAFYQNLQKTPNKAQALRQAMLSTMKTHPEPRDWAAFTLIGEAE